MIYIVYLSGEDIPLALEELRCVISKQGASMEIIHNLGRVLLIDVSGKVDLSDCALLIEASKYIDNLDSINTMDFSPYKNRSINVRVIKANPSVPIVGMDYERWIGSLFMENGADIDLERPDSKIRVYFASDMSFVGELVYLNGKGFSGRKASLRPFHRPVSLDPKLARVMVNLSCASHGSRLLDPFAGTGGILIESCLVGCKSFGLDMDEVMVEGAKKNLINYGCKDYDIRVGDAFDSRQMFGEFFDAIVTDLPYGRNTKSGDMKNLAGRFIEFAPSVLLKTGRLVVSSNYPDISYSDDLELLGKYERYIHGSMSKWIYVFGLRSQKNM